MGMILSEKRHTAGFMVSEARGHRSRDRGVFGGATVIEAGTVLGSLVSGTAGASAKAGNTGNGVLTIDATSPVLANAQLGTYAIRCIAAGSFRVFDPSGDVLGDVAVGGTFSDQIKFGIAAGATGFVVGDEFDIAVQTKIHTFVPLNPAATDGSQLASGISWSAIDTTAGNKTGTVVQRECEVNGSEVVWPAGASVAQISTAVEELQHLGIVVR